MPTIEKSNHPGGGQMNRIHNVRQGAGLVLLAAMAVMAGETRLVPMDAENLPPGRSMFLAPAKDTIPLCGDPAQPALIRIRDVRHGEGLPGQSHGEFRLA